MDCQQQIDFNRERTLKEIFADFWLFFQNEWKQLLTILAIGVFPFALIGSYFMDMSASRLLEGGSIDYKMYVALFFSFMAKYSGIILSVLYVQKYIENERLTYSVAIDYIKANWWMTLKSVVFMLLLVAIGFMLWVIPGLIVLPVAMLIVFDVLFCKQMPSISFIRCISLVKTNWKQGYAIVYMTYIAFFVLNFLILEIVPTSNSIALYFVSALVSVISELMSVIFILLYFSLANQNKRL